MAVLGDHLGERPEVFDDGLAGEWELRSEAGGRRQARGQGFEEPSTSGSASATNTASFMCD